ncbi:MAG TPA: hypothetical protein VFI96_08420 [Longimicrobiaceae bacterium]|nr:hypothetical protein [Longimicrobiaceae bacterium]
MERPTLTSSIGDVLIAVEACGICGADALDVEGTGIATFKV